MRYLIVGAGAHGDLVRRAAEDGLHVPILTAALCNLQSYEINRSQTRGSEDAGAGLMLLLF